MRTRIMYIEDKSGGLTGPCRIGRVSYSKSGRSLYYGGRTFQSLTGRGFKANYFDLESGDHFWISGPRLDGADGLYGRITQPEDVDNDVADAYWRDIRGFNSAPRASAAGLAADPGLGGRAATSEVRPRAHGRKGSRIAALAEARARDFFGEGDALREGHPDNVDASGELEDRDPGQRSRRK